MNTLIVCRVFKPLVFHAVRIIRNHVNVFDGLYLVWLRNIITVLFYDAIRNNEFDIGFGGSRISDVEIDTVIFVKVINTVVPKQFCQPVGLVNKVLIFVLIVCF